MTAFEKFYTTYPRKKARKDAEKAWRQVKADARAAEILAGLERQLPELLAKEPVYRPYAATWLRGERWTDLPDEDVVIPTAKERADFRVWCFALGPSAAGVCLEDWVRRQRGA